MHGGEEKCIQDLALNNQAQMGRIRLTFILLAFCDQCNTPSGSIKCRNFLD
jgi:hypothetical protein